MGKTFQIRFCWGRGQGLRSGRSDVVERVRSGSVVIRVRPGGAVRNRRSSQ
ncbi:hypothetical protein [Azospirillum largimobile]